MRRIPAAALAALLLAPPAHAQEIIPPMSAGGTPFVPGAPAYVASYWYASTLGSTQVGSATGTAGTVTLEPFTVAQSISIDQVGVLVSAASGAGGQAVVYVYGANTAGNRPAGAPIGQCTITSLTSTGFQSCTFSSALGLTGNKLYWFGWEINASATALIAASPAVSTNYNAWQEGIANPTAISAGGSAGLRMTLYFGNSAHTFGTASDPSTYSPAMGETYNLAKVPAMFFRVASVP